MLVTYTPDGDKAQSKSWVFEPGRVRLSEAAAVEKQYGESWEKFVADVQAGGARARRVLLWLLQRRAHPILRFDDTPDFYLDEVVLEHTLDELTAIRARLEQAGLSESDLDTASALLDAQIAEAKTRPDLGGDPGKATSETGL